MRLTSEAAPPSAPAPSSATGLTTVSEAAEEVPKYGVEGTEHELLERVRERKKRLTNTSISPTLRAYKLDVWS